MTFQLLSRLQSFTRINSKRRAHEGSTASTRATSSASVPSLLKTGTTTLIPAGRLCISSDMGGFLWTDERSRRSCSRLPDRVSPELLHSDPILVSGDRAKPGEQAIIGLGSEARGQGLALKTTFCPEVEVAVPGSGFIREDGGRRERLFG